MLSKKDLKMNIKVKAAGATAALIVGAVVAGELIRFIVNYLTTDQLTDIIGTGFAALFVYSLYRLVLCHMEFKKSMEKHRDLEG